MTLISKIDDSALTSGTECGNSTESKKTQKSLNPKYRKWLNK